MRLGKSIEDKSCTHYMKDIPQYRCPGCHYLVEKELLLFGSGCPVCGWISPILALKELSAEYMDVFDDGNIVHVTAELSFVDGKDIRLDVKDNKLVISAGSFKRIVPLRYEVEQHIENTYCNGVLEVKLKRK